MLAGKGVTWAAPGPAEARGYVGVEAPSPTAQTALCGAAGPASDRLPLAWHALNISVSMPNGAPQCFP